MIWAANTCGGQGMLFPTALSGQCNSMVVFIKLSLLFASILCKLNRAHEVNGVMISAYAGTDVVDSHHCHKVIKNRSFFWF